MDSPEAKQQSSKEPVITEVVCLLPNNVAKN